MENEDFFRNLVNLLKMFKNRPHHLAKYLIDNSALHPDFAERIKENYKLKSLSEDENKYQNTYFADIAKMNDFYSSFSDDMKKMNVGKSPEEITSDLNQRLDGFVKEEKYEDAARLRDYMVKNNIKRIKQ